MAGRKILYLVKTDDYSEQTIKPIIKNIKNGEYEHIRVNPNGQIICDVKCIFKNLIIIDFDNRNLITKSADFIDDHTSYFAGYTQGLTCWRAIYILFDDGKEFLLPSDYDRLMKYLKNELDDEDYVDLNNILI